MQNSEIFASDLELINNVDLRESVRRMLNNVVPEYFYIVAASSTGKYHPWYSLGYGGLVRHTKAAVKLAADLLCLEQYLHLPHDEIIAALILHDSFKHGVTYGRWTTQDHPLVAANEIEKAAPENLKDTYALIGSLIRSHMGQWTAVNNVPVLPKPSTEAEKFVHLCDYLASRKYVTVEVI